MAGTAGVITYAAPVIFLLGSVLILLFRSYAKEVAFVLQSIAIALGCALPICFVVRFTDAGTISQDDVLRWTSPAACVVVDAKTGDVRSLEQIARNYGLTTE